MIVSALLTVKDKLHISVLSFYVETTKAIQKAIYQTIGNANNLLIDTVSRIQGLTTDVAIYVLPNTGYTYSLNRSLFNVATSRARRHTIIISDKGILLNNICCGVDKDVINYFKKLNDTQSFYIPINKNPSNALLLEDVAADEPEAKKTTKATNEVIDQSQLDVKQKKSPIAKSAPIIIDTNVFVDEPNIISKIDPATSIIVSAKVIDELDKLKVTLSEEDRPKVQRALKNINSSMDKPNVIFEIANTRLLPCDFDYRSPDNMILAVALKYKDENPILLTSDNGLQLKSKILGISTISLRNFLKR